MMLQPFSRRLARFSPTLRFLIAPAIVMLAVLLSTAVPASAASSKIYYFKHFATNGTKISTWYTNDNYWGVNAPNGSGFVCMVTGEDWGTWSPVHALPKKLSAVKSSNISKFYQKASPAAGSHYDATYDIFIDPSYAPTNRNGKDEIMIWVGYQNTQPLSNKWTASGKAVPWKTNVSLGGRSWDVYLYNWPGGGYTMSYLDRAKKGYWSGSLSPFFNYGISNGWYSKNDYLISVMAGWEFGKGSYTATTWEAKGF
jgi:hypothetical protein